MTSEKQKGQGYFPSPATCLIFIFLFLLPFYIGPTVRYIFSILIIGSSFHFLKQRRSLPSLSEIFLEPVNLAFTVLIGLGLLACFFSPEFTYSLKHVFTTYVLNFFLFISVSYYFREYEERQSLLHLFKWCNVSFLTIYFILLVQWLLYPASPLFFDYSENVLADLKRADLFFLFGNLCDILTTIDHVSIFALLMISIFYSSLLTPGAGISNRTSMWLIFFNLFLLFNTTRRGAMLASVAGMSFVTFLARSYRKHLFVMCGFLVVLVSIFFVTGLKQFIVREDWGLILQGKIEKARELGGSIPLRVSTYRVFMEEIARHPFLPRGPSMKLFKEYHKDVIERAGLVHGHNVFLDFAIQFGIQGALALFIIIALQFYGYYRAYKKGLAHTDRALMLASMAFLIMFWTTNLFTDAFVHGSAALYWLFTGITWGIKWRIVSADNYSEGKILFDS